MFNLFGGNSFIDLLTSPVFRISVAILIVLIVVIIYSFKYPKIGGPVILSLFSLGILGVTAYCGIQLNYYYGAEGGIHGKITGIFKTNEVEVVDNMTFEFKNIELLETSENVYSASILIDKVISLDTKESLGVFVNQMPCDVTSSIHNDYAVAKYVYTFYDNDETIILTDTLTLNFAFYENSTYLSLSTSGGAEAIKYWHYYFNKNGFVVEIAPFEYVDSGLSDGTGDVSNYAIVSYVVEDEVKANQVYSIGSKLKLLTIVGIDDFMCWEYNGEEIKSGFVVAEDMVISAKLSADYDVSFYIDDYLFDSQIVSLENNATTNSFSNGIRLSGETYSRIIDYWTLDGSTLIDVETYPITEDTIFKAVWHKEYIVEFVYAETSTTLSVKENDCVVAPAMPDGYVLDYWTLSGEQVIVEDIVITCDTTFVAVGNYVYPVTFLLKENVVNTQNVIKGGFAVDPRVNLNLDPGVEFLGWSLDGLSVVDIASIEITEDTTFIALLNDVEYTLTLMLNPSESITYTGNYNEIITLEDPTYKDYEFIEWRIYQGNGLVSGNEFTFLDGNCTLNASYNYCFLMVSGDDDFSVIHTNETTENVSKKSGFLSVSWACEEEYSGEITITIDSVYADLTLEYADVDNVIITRQSDNSFIVKWTGSSLMMLKFTSSSLSGV